MDILSIFICIMRQIVILPGYDFDAVIEPKHWRFCDVTSGHGRPDGQAPVHLYVIDLKKSK